MLGWILHFLQTLFRDVRGVLTIVTFRSVIWHLLVYKTNRHHNTCRECVINPLTAGAAYILVFFFISTLITTF